MRRFAAWLVGLLAVLTAAAFIFGQPIAWVQAGLVIWDVAAGPAPTWWKDVTADPSKYTARWNGEEGDVYTPGGKVRAAMVLVPGADMLGRDEPRLQALARTFARAGFVVLVPELPAVRQLALSRKDADHVAAAVRRLRARQPGVRLGIAAVSYAVAPAIIAALDTQPDFVLGIGGYHDSESVIRFITTGAFRPAGEGRLFHVEPNRYGRWAFVLANAGRLDSPLDAHLLQEIARRRFSDPDANVDRLAAKLGPQGHAVLALVENRDPDAVGKLIEALPENIRHEIDGLDLALYDLSKLQGDLILVHGLGDPLVPYSESQDLAAAASNAHVSLFLVGDIGHVELRTVSLDNGLALWRAALALLDERR
ncbi:MAG TPA: hypothetical protein VFB13_04410 [Reyranella sp.]|jgi:fermentation-respiration switch protein FrsA (DUF1100 family)|nr:hypothetical protein [Reyranella sp.]